VHRPDHARDAVGEEDRDAVGDPDADSAGRIVADDHIGLGRFPSVRASSSRDRHTGAMDLPDEEQVFQAERHGPGNGCPLARIVAKPEVARGKEMIGNVEERPAPQQASPRRLRPLESAARLGLDHEYSRARIRRHRYTAHPADGRSLW
jgi:hypothetical protein